MKSEPVLIIVFLIVNLPAIAINTLQVINSKTEPQIVNMGKPNFKVSYSPDYVGSDISRRFFVELNTLYNNSEINLICDEKVSLIDINKNVIKYVNGKKVSTGLQRYYFKTKPGISGKTLLRFQDSRGEVQIPIIIWGYNDLKVKRVVNGVPVPFRYPLYKEPLSYVKTRQTLTKTQPPINTKTDKNILATLPSDDFIWDLLMDEGAVSRMHHVFSNLLAGNERAEGLVVPPPFTAEELTSSVPFSFHFPATDFDLSNLKYWQYNMQKAGTNIPSNNIMNNDFHSGNFVDDGFNGIEIDGHHIHVLGMLNESRKYLLEDMIRLYSNEYQKTGNPYYAHKTLIALCRMAVAFNYLSVMQHFRPYRHSWDGMNMRQRLSDKHIMNTANVGVVDPIGIWESRKPIPSMATAYDIIFNTLSKNSKIIPYLQSKGLPINSIREVQELIEHGIFLSFLQHASAGQAVVNYPLTQNVIAKVIRMLDYPCTDLVDLLYKGDSSPFNTYMNSSFVNSVFYEGFLRDGLKFENSGGYNTNSLAVLNGMEDLNSYMNDHAELFPSEKYPRMNTIKKLELSLKNNIHLAVTPWTRMEVGDASSVNNIGNFKCLEKEKRFFGDETTPDKFIQYYPVFKTPEIAWGLSNSGKVVLPDNYKYTMENLKKESEKLCSTWREGVFAFAGQGITLLRAGNTNHEMGLYTPYQNMPHAKNVSLNLFIDGLGGKLFSSWGYAPYQHYGEPWYYTWAARNCGTIIDDSLNIASEMIGTNELLMATPLLNVSDNYIVKYNEKSQYDTSKWQRRINLQVKIDSTSCYFIDLYRMKGGNRHCRSYNPTLGSCEIYGMKMQPIPGTLAGDSVHYNDIRWVRKYCKVSEDVPVKALRDVQALSLLYDVCRAETYNNTWQAKWKIESQQNKKIDINLKINGVFSDDASIYICTSKDPNNDHPYTRKQIVWDHKSQNREPLSSQVLNTIEAYRGKDSLIYNVYSLPVAGKDEKTLSPLGMMVTRTNGEKDFFILSANDDKKTMKLPNGSIMELTGKIGYARFGETDNLLALEMCEASKLSIDNTCIKNVSKYYCKIDSIDTKEWTIDLSGYTGKLSYLKDKYVYIEKEFLCLKSEVTDNIR